MLETRIGFKDRNNRYTIFIEKRLFHKDEITVLRSYGAKEGIFKGGSEVINAKVSHSTICEDISFWLSNLKRKIFKNRSQKNS